MQSGAWGQTQGCLSPLPPAKEPDIRVSDNGRGQMVPVHWGERMQTAWSLSRFRVRNNSAAEGWISHAFDSAVGGLQECPQSPVPPTAWQPWLRFGCHEGARNSINSLPLKSLTGSVKQRQELLLEYVSYGTIASQNG
ncbi:hypothetical protein QQF64_029186 [Cirrhinus molitorella]|uniref:Uncharacterized protein n=1 Tax=Cirrhinus molitorella TaxID=172907 RepID=A0ABR3N8Z0_9TELE